MIYGIFRQESCLAALRHQAMVGDSLLIGLHWRPQRALLWVRADSPLQHWSELKNVRIGLPALHGVDVEFRAQQWRLWQLIWQHLHVDLTTLNWIDVGIADEQVVGASHVLSPQQRCNDALQQALQQGQVDVVLLYGAIQPVVESTAQIRLFYDVQQLNDVQIDAALTLPTPLTVDRQLWRSHPDLVLRFLQRILAVEDWAAQHPLAAYDYIAQTAGITAAEVPLRFGADIHLRQGTHLAFHMLRALDDYQQFLYRQGLLSSIVTFTEWIEPLPLQILQARHAVERSRQHTLTESGSPAAVSNDVHLRENTAKPTHYAPTRADAAASLW
jgi:ABC-type nitrate/sulfonate/bicarbonate transport system substrate-binding protein